MDADGAADALKPTAGDRQQINYFGSRHRMENEVRCSGCRAQLQAQIAVCVVVRAVLRIVMVRGIAQHGNEECQRGNARDPTAAKAIHGKSVGGSTTVYGTQTHQK